MNTLFIRVLYAVFAMLALPGLTQAASLEQMAGQMIVVGFQGDSMDDPAVVALREDLAESRLGGVMLLKTNIKSLDAVGKMNAAFRAASPELLPFITIEQEGGAVERLTKAVGFDEIPNAATIAKTHTPEQAEAIYARMAASMA